MAVLKKRVDFGRYSSIKIGPVLDVVLIDKIEKIPDEFYIVGGANNLLVSNNPPPLAMLSKRFDYIEIKNGKLHIGAATKGGRVVSFAKKHNIANFEFMQKIPGTIGGMIKMNAGLKNEEIFNHLTAVKTHKGYIKKEDILHGYRYAYIEEAVFEAVFEIQEGFSQNKIEIFKKIRKNQPSDPSAGSCFKNPPSDYAGRLIEEVGLRGYRINDAAFSFKHANFLINLKNASFGDAIELIKEAKRRVYDKFRIILENEVKIL